MEYESNFGYCGSSVGFDEIDRMWKIKDETDSNAPVNMTAHYLNRDSHFFHQPNPGVNIHQSMEKIAEPPAATNQSNNAEDPLDVKHGILNDSYIDFDFLQFYGDKIDQSSAAVPSKTSDAMIPHSNDTNHLLTNSNEIEQLLGTLGVANDEITCIDSKIDEDSMRFLERIVDEANNNQDCSTAISRKSLECDSNNNTKPKCSTSCQLSRDDASNSSDGQKLICQFCNKQFIRRKFFDLHVESHIQPRHFKCGECAEIFTTNKRLMVHTTTKHGKGVIYSCYLCKSFFTSREGLRLHMNLKHTGRLLRRCTVCARGFPAAKHLARHMQTHANSGSFECNVCLIRFTRLRTLKTHITKMHRIGCKDQNFRSERLLKQPTSLTLSYRSDKNCLLSSKEFVSASSALRHINSIPTKKKSHECKICSKRFSSANSAFRHTNAIHTKNILYECNICPRKYYYRESLRKHVKNAHNRFRKM